MALALLNFKLSDGSYAIPSPQVLLPNGLGESTFSIPARYREDQFSVNLDQTFSERNQLSGRFFSSLGTTNEPFTPFAATVPGFGTNQNERNDMFVLSETHVFTPNLINVARFGYMRFNGFLSGVSPITAADVGMATPSDLPEIAGIDVSGLFNIGPSGEPFYFQNTNTFVWQDTVSLTHGAHSLRMGAEAKRHEVDVNVPYVTAGFIFLLSFPDFLLGQRGTQNGSGQSNLFESVGASGLFRKDVRYTDFAGFVQDDIKATPRLILNAGLRYEFFGPPSEIRGRLSNFNPAIATPQVPSTGSFSGFVLPANFTGPIPSGVTKTPYSGMWNPDYTDFSPRFGFALRLSEKPFVVVRGGYGIYYSRLSGEVAEQNIGQPPFALTQSLQGVGNAAATFAEPYNPPLPPNSAYPIYIPRTPNSAISIAAVGQNLTSPYAQQYDLDFQYEFANDFLWQVGYLRWHFLEGMSWDLLDPYLTPLHAACVRLGDCGVLLCGDSGAGKSSLAFACALSGWTYLADDSCCLLHRNPSRVVVGNPYQIRFRESAIELFPELKDQRLTRRATGEMAIEVPTAGLPGMKIATKCVVDFIVFLNRSQAGPSSLSPFPKDKALHWFEQVMRCDEKETVDAHKAALKQLLQAEILELRYADLESAIGELTALARVG